jgi:hypothetical protein
MSICTNVLGGSGPLLRKPLSLDRRLLRQAASVHSGHSRVLKYRVLADLNVPVCCNSLYFGGGLQPLCCVLGITCIVLHRHGGQT